MTEQSHPFLITRKIEIDAAHRVPDHKSKCFAVHGHRYVIEASCIGPTIKEGEQRGMVMDFGFLKACMMRAIHDPCDHGIILWKQDPMLREISPLSGKFNLHKWWKVELMDDVPTAENLAKMWYERLAAEIHHFFEARLDEEPEPHLDGVKVWETPNCWAQWPW